MLSYLIKFVVEGVVVFDFVIFSFFYLDSEDDFSESEEVLFCKNNVCVYFFFLSEFYFLGYFILKFIIY